MYAAAATRELANAHSGGPEILAQGQLSLHLLQIPGGGKALLQAFAVDLEALVLVLIFVFRG